MEQNKKLIKSLDKILKELETLENSREFVGIYLDRSYFIDLQILLEDVKQTIIKDETI